MILERIYDMALPRLKGRTVKEVRIGLELMAVELDNGLIGDLCATKRGLPGSSSSSWETH